MNSVVLNLGCMLETIWKSLWNIELKASTHGLVLCWFRVELGHLDLQKAPPRVLYLPKGEDWEA